MSFKRVINVVETHDGEPMRVVTGGVGHIPGNSVYEMEEYLRLHNDGCVSSCCGSQEGIHLCAVISLFRQSIRMRRQVLSSWSRPNIL